MKVVIIGGVAGGASAAARLRRLDEEAQIVILEKSGYISYANCGLPYYIGGEIRDPEKLTLQTPESFKSRFNIDVRVHHEALMIVPDAKTVRVRDLDAGTQYDEPYDKLILSPGARPFVPDVPGTNLERVFTLRNVENTFAIDAFIRENAPKTAVVVGGGFIGLEMTENLVNRGIAVTLVERMDQVLPPLDRDLAGQLHAVLKKKGVVLKLSAPLTGFEARENGALAVRLPGETLEADFALLAIGVVPDTALAKEAGFELGARGAIAVDAHMRTSVPDIYAVGDAVQVTHAITGKPTVIPLAGPANKQGRIVADNICGRDSVYKGSQGSSILKLFDTAAGVTGLNERAARAAGFDCDYALMTAASHATYYPGAENITVKVIYEKPTGRILGAELIGKSGVDKRIDVLATAIRAGMTAEDLTELELAYAPPFSSAKDPVNMIGYIICNVLDHTVKQIQWPDLAPLLGRPDVVLLDTRTVREYETDHLACAVNIPLDELRARLGELDRSKTIYVHCLSGLRSYLACRILSQNGFDCRNVAGGWRAYATLRDDGLWKDALVQNCGVPEA